LLIRPSGSELNNRDFRLDPSLKLSAIKDNLKTRLLLLARRLAEKAWPIRVDRSVRGRLTLLVDGSLALTDHN
jgi:adenylate cyclase